MFIFLAGAAFLCHLFVFIRVSRFHPCLTAVEQSLPLSHYQRDDVRSGDFYNVIQGAAMNAENKLFQPVKFGAIYPILGAQAFVGALAAQEHAF